MQVTIRLYRQHDMDLVALYRTEGFSFQKAMKEALRAFATKQDYRIKRPRDAKIKPGYVPKLIQMHIKLDPQKDADSVKALSYIRYGYRSSFLKALFRKYMTSEPLDAYRNRNDLIFDAEKDYITEHHPPKDDAEPKNRHAKNSGTAKSMDKGRNLSKARAHSEKSDQAERHARNVESRGVPQTGGTGSNIKEHSATTNAAAPPDMGKEAAHVQDERINTVPDAAPPEDETPRPPEDETPGIFDTDDIEAAEPQEEKPVETAEPGSPDDTSQEKKDSDDGFGLFSDDEEDTTDDDYADILKAMNSLAH